MINKKIVFTLFLLLIVITAGCLSDSTQPSSDISQSAEGVDTGSSPSSGDSGSSAVAGTSKLEIEYVNEDSALKLSDIKPGKIFIEKANPPSSYITGAFFVIAVKDIPTMPSITVGETTLSNFRVVTIVDRDIATIEWDIASRSMFSVSMATLAELPLTSGVSVDSGPSIEISGNEHKLGKYSFDKWSQARYVFVTVNSP